MKNLSIPFARPMISKEEIEATNKVLSKHILTHGPHCRNFEKDFKFVRDVGVTFQMIFNNIIKRKIKKKWTLKDKEMQYIKRGRYAEFNLLYDRGTKFGLNSNGNPEAILMSMPPTAKWK